MMHGARQIRLSDPVIIRQRIRDFLGKKINIVLCDNRVLIGELKAVDDSGILVENMRLKKTSFQFNELSEIYFDAIV
jgi:hypothetical protein